MAFSNCRNTLASHSSARCQSPLRWPACSPAPARVQAQDYPTRAVKIIVPFPAGGSADVMPRVVGDWLSHKWGQPVVIENRVGAAGNIGSEIAYKAEPDGYTLLSAPPPPLVINQNLYPKLNFDPSKFIPIVVMARIPNSLVVTPNFRAQDGRRGDRLRQGQSGQDQLRHPGRRHDLASHLRDVPDDGGREIPARALYRARRRR